jgi:diguanylate cyclase (GGDEF)-like protein/PAS domain S-box-containing protein
MNEILSQTVSILVIEDDPGDFGLVRAHVRLSGLVPSGDKEPVVWARTLAEGIAAARNNDPDVVLLDLSLPDSDGLDTVKGIRAAMNDVPIVVLTGHNDDSLATAALQNGAQDYLVKGNFDHDSLGRAVRHAVVRGALESRLRLFEVAMNAAANGIFITDTRAHVQWANPAFSQLTGFSLDEVMGRNPMELMKSGKQDDAFYHNMWKTILSGKAWHSEIVNRRKDGSLYDENLIITPVTGADGTVSNFVAIMQDITERKRAEEQVHHMAHHDTLTGLPNRMLFSDRLQQAFSIARRKNSCMALMFIDLDKFKPINDNFGHQVGDLLLKEVAKRMQDCVRESDTVARIGGDEFIVLLPVIEAVQDALLVAEKIRRSLNQPFVLAGQSLNISSSTGIAVYPDHGKDETQLMKNADTAMYCAKEGGRNSVKQYQPDMDDGKAT